MSRPLRIAVPSKGRLAAPTQDLFASAGLRYDLAGRLLRQSASDTGVEFLLARADDIPTWVADGAADLGVAGLNQLVESGIEHELLTALPFGRCRLVLAAPHGSASSATELAGRRIATSYPRTTGAFLDARGIDATVVGITGSVELAPSLDAAEAIADLVSTGETLRQNGLVEIETILDSNAVAFAVPGPVGAAARGVQVALEAVLAARPRRYLMLNAPDDRLDEILALLPGLSAPTVLPLARSGMHAVHAVVSLSELPTVLDPLRAAGASGILVLPIEYLIP